jgi:hypothetical protein
MSTGRSSIQRTELRLSRLNHENEADPTECSEPRDCASVAYRGPSPRVRRFGTPGARAHAMTALKILFISVCCLLVDAAGLCAVWIEFRVPFLRLPARQKTRVRTRSAPMRFCSLILIALVCAACQQTHSHLLTTASLAATNDMVVPPVLSEFEGSLYCFQTTQSAVEAAPQWKARAEFPPLSPRRAAAAALKEAGRLRPDVSVWRVESIALQPCGGENYWIYRVVLWRGDIAITGLPSFLEIPLLMNGKVIHPARNPK